MAANDSWVDTRFGVDILVEKDVMVPLRSDLHICADVYRPTDDEPVPALLAICPHNKELQSLDLADAVPPQPAWSPTWCGPAEAGDTPYFVANGYAHVTANPQGVGKSEGDPAEMDNRDDLYDVIEWIADQDWCTGKVGMTGISGFGGYQLLAAEADPPHLEAIFPYDPRGLDPFRDSFPGGLLSTFLLNLGKYSVRHRTRRPPELTGEEEERWLDALEDPWYRQHPLIYNTLSVRGMLNPPFFEWLIDPYDDAETQAEVEARVERVNEADIPTYLGTGWYAYTYKYHLRGNFRWNERLDVPRKMLLRGFAHLERPQHELAEEIVRWYDHWLKGEDTGIMDEPFGRLWVMGAREYCHFEEWPLAATDWTDLYLDSWERLRHEPFKDPSYEGYADPDAFTQQPATMTREIETLRYLTEPLSEDTLVIGPASLTLYAAIDSEDTSWIATLKDVGPDVSVQAGREGWERRYSQPEVWERPDVHERELTRGWLRASHRALDQERTAPGRPYHRHTRDACEPVEPGEIERYDIEILPTANLFKRDHRICLEISSLDLPSGVGGDTAVEYIPWHVCHPDTVTHEVYRDADHPSHLTLPVIPDADAFLTEHAAE